MSNIKLQYIDLLGVPFKMGGRTKEEGFDCYGLYMEIMKRLGKPIPSDYISCDDLLQRSSSIERGIHELGFTELDRPEAFCSVAFMIYPPLVTHMGVVLEDVSQFIHIMKHQTVVISKLTDYRWKKKLAGFYKYSP